MSASTIHSTETPSRPSPVIVAIGIWLAFLALSIGGTLALGALAPGLVGKGRDLIVEVALAAFALVIIAARGWRRELGLTSPRTWAHPRLLIFPALVLLIPFLGGVRAVDGSTIVLLVVGYTLNAVAEDGVFRGILPQVLRPRGLVWVVVLSSLLFGLSHFGNILSRPDQSVAITAAQALGAFTDGIGLVAIRLAMRSVVPVMILHLLGDLFFQLGGLPIVPANVINSVLILLFGLWVLRRHRAELAAEGWR